VPRWKPRHDMPKQLGSSNRSVLLQRLALVFCVCLASCQHSSPPSLPSASLGDFTDQVLEPLAVRLADEKIIQDRADSIARFTPKASERGVQDLLTGIPYVGKLLEYGESTRKAELEEELAWLETRRIPLKREILDLFVSRTVPTNAGFSVCVEGRQRQYKLTEGGRFTRLADGSERCDTTELKTLKRQTN
jgi:hypothetical protein